MGASGAGKVRNAGLPTTGMLVVAVPRRASHGPVHRSADAAMHKALPAGYRLAALGRPRARRAGSWTWPPVGALATAVLHRAGDGCGARVRGHRTRLHAEALAAAVLRRAAHRCGARVWGCNLVGAIRQ